MRGKGLRGGEAELHRYLAEFDFRHNRRAALKISERERAEDLLRQARDKCLTYRRIGETGYAQAKGAKNSLETEETQPVNFGYCDHNLLHYCEQFQNILDGGH